MKLVKLKKDTKRWLSSYQISEIVVKLYKKCIPAVIKHRKNVDKLVQPDTVIIACVLWGFMLGYNSQGEKFWVPLLKSAIILLKKCMIMA